MNIRQDFCGSEGASTFVAGAATVDITPRDSQFLFGYPHVERYSMGVHDPLLSTALFLAQDSTQVLFVANDLIYVSKAITARVRQRIAQATSVPESHIMIAATHTHSGPITVDLPSSEGDPVVPKVDPDYLRFIEDQMVEAAMQACQNSEPAEAGLVIADGSGVGTNRRDPDGPSNPEVPVFLVRSLCSGRPLACMLVCSMHPTVLHEDSMLFSADFPGMTRRHLQEGSVGEECPVLFHTGPCGNQSPRHVTKANTFAEAERLGRTLGQAIADVIPSMAYIPDLAVECVTAAIDLPRRTFPSAAKAEEGLDAAVARLAQLRRDGASKQAVRTAECDWFGAEETLTLARAAAEGRLEAAYAACLPAEIQVIRVGPWAFVAWPGEVFVEYALTIRAQCPDAHIISLANGELHGYIVTEAALAEGGYEASNALFSPEAGGRLVEATLGMLRP
jgi:neutral/alkaline ceramidase-like enzyme